MCCTFKSNLTKRLLKVLSVTPVLWSLLMGEGAEPLLGLYTIPATGSSVPGSSERQSAA